MIIRDKISVFTGNGHPKLAKSIAAQLDLPLGLSVVNSFPDGEINVKIDEDIRGSDVFIIQSTWWSCCSSSTAASGPRPGGSPR